MLCLKILIVAFVPVLVLAEPITGPGVFVGSNDNNDFVVDLFVIGVIDVKDASNFGEWELLTKLIVERELTVGAVQLHKASQARELGRTTWLLTPALIVVVLVAAAIAL